MIKFRDEVECLPHYEFGGAFADEMRKHGVTRVVRLNSNEGPYSPFPEAIEVMRDSLSSLNRYPDASYAALRFALSKKYSVPVESVVVGPGSVSLLQTLATVVVSPGDEAVFCWPTFPPPATSVLIMGGVLRKVPLKNYTHDLPAMLEAVTEKTKIVYICNPNNPTGTVIGKAELDDYFRKVPDHVLTVLDEAYIEYVEDANCPDGLDYLGIDKPVILFRTFSKVYGLAGLRVGFGFGHPDLANVITRAQSGYCINALGHDAAVTSLERGDLVDERRAANAAGLAYFATELERLGLTYSASRANFAFVDVKQDAREVFRKLMRQGVLVRPGNIYDSPSHIRVTVGTPEENEIFIGALRNSL